MSLASMFLNLALAERSSTDSNDLPYIRNDVSLTTLVSVRIECGVLEGARSQKVDYCTH